MDGKQTLLENGKQLTATLPNDTMRIMSIAIEALTVGRNDLKKRMTADNTKEAVNSTGCALCKEILKLSNGCSILKYSESSKVINMVRKLAQNPCPIGENNNERDNNAQAEIAWVNEAFNKVVKGCVKDYKTMWLCRKDAVVQLLSAVR